MDELRNIIQICKNQSSNVLKTYQDIDSHNNIRKNKKKFIHETYNKNQLYMLDNEHNKEKKSILTDNDLFKDMTPYNRLHNMIYKNLEFKKVEKRPRSSNNKKNKADSQEDILSNRSLKFNPTVPDVKIKPTHVKHKSIDLNQ